MIGPARGLAQRRRPTKYMYMLKVLVISSHTLVYITFNSHAPRTGCNTSHYATHKAVYDMFYTHTHTKRAETERGRRART